MDEEIGDMETSAAGDGSSSYTSMDAAKSAMRREAGIIDPAREARVKQILDKIKRDKKFYEEGAFKRIRQDIKFAANLKDEQ